MSNWNQFCRVGKKSNRVWNELENSPTESNCVQLVLCQFPILGKNSNWKIELEILVRDTLSTLSAVKDLMVLCEYTLKNKESTLCTVFIYCRTDGMCDTCISCRNQHNYSASPLRQLLFWSIPCKYRSSAKDITACIW